jgi:hypothetical protein
MSKMDHEEAIEIIKAFASGQIMAEEFWEKFKADETIKDILVNDEEKWEKELALASPTKGGKWSSSALAIYEKPMNFGSYLKTEKLHWIVRKYVLRNKIPVKIDTFYSDRYMFLRDIQPSWLRIDDEDFLKDHLIDKIPADMKTRGQKVKWCKEKLKEMFRYDKTPPRWGGAPPPQWPIVNGKPLVFRRKSRESIDDEQVDFYFYDPDTMEETVVTQFY